MSPETGDSAVFCVKLRNGMKKRNKIVSLNIENSNLSANLPIFGQYNTESYEDWNCKRN